jgi:hypothetical protein
MGSVGDAADEDILEDVNNLYRARYGNTGLYGFKDGKATFGLKENGSFFFGEDANN